jgi:predicted enzyme related to lactoylglutathione lyase
MTRFYRDVLGFTETFRTPAEGVPVHVELRLAGLVVGMAGVDAAYERVVAAGAAPLAPPHDFLGSVRAAWVADPEGNPVELVMRRG